MVFIEGKIDLKSDRTYVVNLDEQKSIGTHCLAINVIDDNGAYFDTFAAEHKHKYKHKLKHSLFKKLLNKKSIRTNISRIKAYNSVIC